MSRSHFQKGNRIETVDAMIDYVLFMQNIARREEIPGAVLTLSQTIDELKLEKEKRLAAREAEHKQRA